MIVPAMSPKELYKEIIDDAASVIKMVNTKMHIQMHVMKRTHQFRWVETLHIKSARKNEWSVVINMDHTKGVQEFNLYVKTNDKQGLAAYSVLIIDKIPALIKYNAHFFKRYRERMFLEETKPDQVLKKFFRNNIHFTPAYSEQVENEPVMAVISLPQGMGLGRFCGDIPITEMKTFIAHDTLNKGQREMVQMLNEDESFQEKISFIGEQRA